MFKMLVRVTIGFILACIAAGLVTVLFVTTPAEMVALPSEALPEKASQTLVWGLLAATHAAIFAAAFTLIAAGIGEWQKIRGLGFYLLAGLVIAALGFYAQYASEVAGQATIYNFYAMTAFATAGLMAGFVYWLSAGRYAGPDATSDGPTTKRKVETPKAIAPPINTTSTPRMTVADRTAAKMAASLKMATASTEPTRA